MRRTNSTTASRAATEGKYGLWVSRTFAGHPLSAGSCGGGVCIVAALARVLHVELRPGTVRGLYKRRGKAAVRDYLIDLLIREDLADPSRVVTPDSKPDTSIFENK